MKIWKIIAGHDDNDFSSQMIARGVVAVGWGAIGPNGIKVQTEAELKNEIEKAYPEKHINNINNGSRSIWRLKNEVQIGDWIILKKKHAQAFEIVGPIEFDQEGLGVDYCHQRKCTPIELPVETLLKRGIAAQWH